MNFLERLCNGIIAPKYGILKMYRIKGDKAELCTSVEFDTEQPYMTAKMRSMLVENHAKGYGTRFVLESHEDVAKEAENYLSNTLSHNGLKFGENGIEKA